MDHLFAAKIDVFAIKHFFIIYAKRGLQLIFVLNILEEKLAPKVFRQTNERTLGTSIFYNPIIFSFFFMVVMQKRFEIHSQVRFNNVVILKV